MKYFGFLLMLSLTGCGNPVPQQDIRRVGVLRDYRAECQIKGGVYRAFPHTSGVCYAVDSIIPRSEFQKKNDE